MNTNSTPNRTQSDPTNYKTPGRFKVDSNEGSILGAGQTIGLWYFISKKEEEKLAPESLEVKTLRQIKLPLCGSFSNEKHFYFKYGLGPAL